MDSKAECFVDASAEFSSHHEDRYCQAPDETNGGVKGEDGGDSLRESTSADLRVRLEETTVILRMALNNEFVRALEICAPR